MLASHQWKKSNFGSGHLVAFDFYNAGELYASFRYNLHIQEGEREATP